MDKKILPRSQAETLKQSSSSLYDEYASIGYADEPETEAQTVKKALKRHQSLHDWCLENGDWGQRLLTEWVYDKNLKELYVTPDTISRGSSSYKVWWKCQICNHEWQSTVNNRTSTMHCGCPSCSGKVVTEKNSLSTWCKNNGDWGKRLLAEWVYDKNLNELSVTPDTVSRGSAKDKVYWKCQDCGYEWTATVNNRTSTMHHGCPNCNHTATSYPEQFIYWALKQIWSGTENRARVLKSPKNPQGIEFDVCIPDIPLCIEYSPTFWHTGREEIGALKAEACRQYNVNYLLIVEDDFNELEEAFTPNYICIKKNYKNQDEQLTKIAGFILNQYNHSISEIDLELVKSNAWKYSHNKIEYEKSLAHIYPKLAEEWHKTLNGKATPDKVASGSHIKRYWQCQKCDYGKDGEWWVSPNSRTRKGCESGCPNCGYSWFNGKIHVTKNKTITGTNDIATKCPKIAEEIHPTLNGSLSPSEISFASHKDIYWQCPNCQYGKDGEWIASPNGRTRKGHETGCPNCGYNWNKAQTGQPQKYKGIYRYQYNITDKQT